MPLAVLGIVWAPFSGVRRYILARDGRIHNDDVFHGFHSREEAEAFWGAAVQHVLVT